MSVSMRTAGVRLVIVAAVAAGAAPAAPAAAAIPPSQECQISGSVFVPVATRVSAKVVRTVPPMPGLALRAGRIDGVTYAWAQQDRARRGDRIWMDWSTDRVRGWLQCGPIQRGYEAWPPGADTTFARLATSGLRTSANNSYRFRACGQIAYGVNPGGKVSSYSPVYCTGWW